MLNKTADVFPKLDNQVNKMPNGQITPSQQEIDPWTTNSNDLDSRKGQGEISA